MTPTTVESTPVAVRRTRFMPPVSRAGSPLDVVNWQVAVTDVA
jgi:hypothetical protein